MEPSDIVSTFSVLTPCKICLCALFFSPSFCLQVHLLLFPSTLFHDLQLLLRSSPSNTNSTLSGLYLFCFLFFFFFALTTFSFMGRRAKRSREMEKWRAFLIFFQFLSAILLNLCFYQHSLNHPCFSVH